MNKHIIRSNSEYPFEFFEGQTFIDPFLPASKSKSSEHEKRFERNENSQNLLKNEEIEG